MTLTDAPDFIAIKARQQKTWASGDYHAIATIIVPIAERLCDAIGLRAGERVIDVATGSGNAALAAARRMCDVTGFDYVPSLLERGRARAAAEGLRVTFEHGDAEALPASDDEYDVALSTVGIMFAPNQEQASRELLRVVRPGGRIGLASWTPNGWIGEMLRVVGRHVPPPAGVRPVTRWGTEEGIYELIGNGVSSLEMKRQTFVWRFERPEQYLDLFRDFYGPTYKAFESLDNPGRAALAADLLDALERHAEHAEDGNGTLLVPSEYLEVIAVKAS